MLSQINRAVRMFLLRHGFSRLNRLWANVFGFLFVGSKKKNLTGPRTEYRCACCDKELEAEEAIYIKTFGPRSPGAMERDGVFSRRYRLATYMKKWVLPWTEPYRDYIDEEYERRQREAQ